MKKSVKALLWSGLLFPGTGHFYLKRNQRGWALFLPALVGFILFIRGLLQQVEYVWDKLSGGTIAPDPVAIASMLDSVPESRVADIGFWVFVLCWVAGMIDAYLQGEQIEKDAASPQKPQT